MVLCLLLDAQLGDVLFEPLDDVDEAHLAQRLKVTLLKIDAVSCLILMVD